MENPFRIVHSMDDIIFEGRNKAYGAYSLRHLYAKHMARALLLAVSLLLLAVNTPLIVKWIKGFQPEVMEQINVTTVTLAEPPVYHAKPLAPPPTPAKPQPARNQKAFVPPVVVNENEDIAENTSTPTIDELQGNEIGADTIMGNAEFEGLASSDNGMGIDATIDPPTADGAPMLYVEQMPVFPGGTEAMYKYISNKIKYPNYASENGISGQVVIQFVVSRYGDIQNARIVRSLGGGFDEEALRVINQMPKWKPGVHNGRPVPVMFTLPIKFTLQ